MATRKRAGVVLPLIATVALSGCAFLTRSSVGPTDSEQRSQFSQQPGTSANGRFTTFVSGGFLYVRDNVGNTTRTVGDSVSAVSMSNDGRFIAYTSSSGAEPGTTVLDTSTGQTRVAGCGGGRVSGDGHHLAYTCVGSIDYLGHTFNFLFGPYLMNLDTGAVAGPFAGGGASLPYQTVSDFQISDDGGTVMYRVDTVPTGEQQIQFGFANGSHTNGASPVGTYEFGLSGDGTRFVVATRDEPAAGSSTIRIGATSAPTTYLHTYVSTPVDRVMLSRNGALLGAVVTIDGVKVAARRATDGSDDWRIVSRTADDTRIAAVTDAVMSSAGTWFAFASDDAGLVAGDTNGVRDVFTRSVDHVVERPTG